MEGLGLQAENGLPERPPVAVQVSDPSGAPLDQAAGRHRGAGIAEDVGPGLLRHAEPGRGDLRKLRLQPAGMGKDIARLETECLGDPVQCGDHVPLAGRETARPVG